MQHIEDGTIVFSASDLTAAAQCEWALVRRIDRLLGYDIEVPKPRDAMLERTGELGDAHEQEMLQHLQKQYPGGVTCIDRPDYEDQTQSWSDQMELATAATLAALRAQHPVVFQGAFFDGQFQGFADFLILNSAGEYEVNDTKLARKAKITALIQLAAYADQLHKNAIPTSNTVHLILGDGKKSTHDLREILPVYLKRRQRMLELIAQRTKNRSSGGSASPWNDPAFSACGSCPVCALQVQEHDDLLLVAGMRLSQRARLRAAGIETLEQLAQTGLTAVPGVANGTFNTLKAQAEVQYASRIAADPGIPVFRVHNPQGLAVIPSPSAGDIFFDFEGDPLYQEGNTWNLDYLFGYVDSSRKFTSIWAHNFTEEKQALLTFLDQVKTLRLAHPDMHIYHYASYERTHLLSLAARYGVGEEFIDDLLRDNVLIDLYPIVKNTLRVGSPSYSIKKLEPLYMQDEDARADLATAADSVVEYANYCDLIAAGDTDAAARKLLEIADYNEYDCISTLMLRDWLLARATEHGVPPMPPSARVISQISADAEPLFDSLMALISDTAPHERTRDQTAVALAAAAIDFHRRENKSFWWEHFNRLSTPIEDWEDTRDVYVVNSAQVAADWHKNPPQRNLRRHYLVQTTPAPGSRMSEGQSVHLLFPADAEGLPESSSPGALRTRAATVIAVHDETTFTVEEVLPKGVVEHDFLPVALTPGIPPKTGALATAIAEWGSELLASYPEMPRNAAMDILRRQPPRGGGIHPVTGGRTAEAITATLLQSENSYVAVQGPPGAGKSFNGGKVIAELVREHGWKVGIVGQSHATVENLLRSVINAGLDSSIVAKPIKDTENLTAVAALGTTTWTPLSREGVADFLGAHNAAVIGGTVWDFANVKKVERGQLDLLVIDEAGQYSLANTIAASVSAKRLLLLGDPQQLPQVTQGSHPEPIDGSALGWLIEDHEVLPDHLGYFLDTSWRMHADVCAVVSELSYDGRLHSHPADRHLEGTTPGVFPLEVVHSHNSTESIEEAAKVVDLVSNLITQKWIEDGTATPLAEAEDNIIVVAPYNAQVNLIRKQLDAAGHTTIRVGTVDKFQGQEAAIAIVSLSASAAEEVPRGIEFLLLTNRLNVAISRAKWAAYLLYSPELTEFVPTNLEQLTLLSRFITLTEAVTPGGKHFQASQA